MPGTVQAASERRSKPPTGRGVMVAKRVTRLGGAVLGFVIVTLPLGAAAQTTSTPAGSGSFDGTAAAYGFNSTISNPSIPLGLVIQGAGPTAQAELSSLQQSNAFASFPYPGDTVSGLPGLASGALLGGLPLPAYPFYVSSSFGQAPASASYPGIALNTQSLDTGASASALVGTSAVGYSAVASVTQAKDSTVTATATATFQGLNFGPFLKLGPVVSTATEVLNPDGTRSSKSTLSFVSITAPGLKLAIPKTTPTEVGIPVPIPGLPQLPILKFPPVPIPFGGTTLDAPTIGFFNGQFTVTLPFIGSQQFAIPASAALAALKAAGIDLRYQAATQTKDGIVAPDLVITTTLPALPKNTYFNGSTPVTITIGGTTASIQSVGAPPPPPPEVATGTGTGSAALTPAAGSSGLSAAGGQAPSAPSAVGGMSSAPVVNPSSGQPTVAALAPTLSGRITNPSSIFGIYLVLAGVALVGTLLSQALRYMGVRSSWNS